MISKSQLKRLTIQKAPYIVLATYKPTIMPADQWNSGAGWRCWKIGEDLCEITKKAGYVPLDDPNHPCQEWTPWSSYKLHAEVHKYRPDVWLGKTKTTRAYVAEGFHQDSDLDPGAIMDHTIIVWASTMPTEIQSNNKIYQPKPFELVAFRNLDCHHRRPANTPELRFFFHQAVENL